MIYTPYTKLSDDELLARVATMDAPGDLVLELSARLEFANKLIEDGFYNETP